MAWQVMPEYDSYSQARQEFTWELPDTYNPARDFLQKHERTDRPALIIDDPAGASTVLSFDDLDERSSRLAAALADRGIEPGDRVGVVIPQRSENPVSHLANWKLGAVSIPLTVLFGRMALQYRLADSDARAVIIDPTVRETIDDIWDECPRLEVLIELGETASGNALAFDELLAQYPPSCSMYDSTPETATAIMYTSGSTAPPKGVLHSHALWLGRAAAAQNYFEGLGDATVWTPADWAWGAALGGTVFAAWHHGQPVVGQPRESFDPAAAFDLMADYAVTHAFMPPTALRMLMSVDDPPVDDLAVETFASAGEPLTPEIITWVTETFAETNINEFYGQTELNLVVGNCSRWFASRPGSMGRPLPGYDVRVVDPDTRESLDRGEAGELAVRPGDRRVFFDEYWGLPDKTAAKQTDDGWFLTGDIVELDTDGFLWFISRADDVILTSGYRVGPLEVEEAILQHSAVEQAAVIGVPDAIRGEAIKAFVQPSVQTYDATEVRDEIQSIVRNQLAAYEYPRKIEFVESLPQTSTGKIRRVALRDQEDST